MKVTNLKCVTNIKCHDCGKELRENKDHRICIMGKSWRNGILLCKDCLEELKKELEAI